MPKFELIALTLIKQSMSRVTVDPRIDSGICLDSAVEFAALSLARSARFLFRLLLSLFC